MLTADIYLLVYQEQQLYYKEITEACVGSCESRRAVSSLLLFLFLHKFLGSFTCIQVI